MEVCHGDSSVPGLVTLSADAVLIQGRAGEKVDSAADAGKNSETSLMLKSCRRLRNKWGSWARPPQHEKGAAV